MQHVLMNFLTILFTALKCASALVITCHHQHFVYTVNETQSFSGHMCLVMNKIETKSRGTEITKVEIGKTSEFLKHSFLNALKNISEFKGFDVLDSSLPYLPTGIDKFFPNLVDFAVISCGLKEIKQSDLKGFPNLLQLSLKYNALEVLEKDLFKFNSKLKRIYLELNLIKEIDGNLFDNLMNLRYLSLEGNECISSTSFFRKDVEKQIQVIREKCTKTEAVIEPKDLNHNNEKKQENDFLIFVGCGVVLGTIGVAFVLKLVLIVKIKLRN
ncbi:unnamed protein product [Chironomus riparius]|uniref:Uncharacterized protein n=1 Tax=Chironomus riparius TaxID=315576 RepID=A0A9N9S7W2_9DIPT|nr:unnamed protein product [Chironomus riparius]